MYYVTALQFSFVKVAENKENKDFIFFIFFISWKSPKVNKENEENKVFIVFIVFFFRQKRIKKTKKTKVYMFFLDSSYFFWKVLANEGNEGNNVFIFRFGFLKFHHSLGPCASFTRPLRLIY